MSCESWESLRSTAAWKAKMIAQPPSCFPAAVFPPSSLPSPPLPLPEHAGICLSPNTVEFFTVRRRSRQKAPVPKSDPLLLYSHSLFLSPHPQSHTHTMYHTLRHTHTSFLCVCIPGNQSEGSALCIHSPLQFYWTLQINNLKCINFANADAHIRP